MCRKFNLGPSLVGRIERKATLLGPPTQTNCAAQFELSAFLGPVGVAGRQMARRATPQGRPTRATCLALVGRQRPRITRRIQSMKRRRKCPSSANNNNNNNMNRLRLLHCCRHRRRRPLCSPDEFNHSDRSAQFIFVQSN